MKGRRWRSSEAGFTLLEMIVALAILGLILGLLGGAAKLLRGTGDRLVARGAAVSDIALLNAVLQERLGDAVALDFGTPGRWVTSFDGRPDTARFLTLSPGFAPGEPLALMGLAAAASGGLELLRAEIAADERSFAALDDVLRVERRALAVEVSGLSLSYFGSKDGATTAGWHPTWQDQRRLPMAVKLEVAHDLLDIGPIIVPIRQSSGTLCATPEPGPECDGG